MTEKTSVLIITPHPDDAEGGAGGTAAKWAAEGAEVVLVVCTNGDKGTTDRHVDSKQLATTRRKEQLEASKVLGLSEVVFLGFPDQCLKNSTDLLENLVRQIRTHRPDIVVTIDPEKRYIRHRDHFVTGRSTLDAIFPFARDHLSFPEHLSEGLEPHKVGEVYLWGSEFPDHFIDITDTFGIKFDALYCHASQMKRPRKESETRARTVHAEAGKNIGVELAESFKRIVLPS